MLSITLNSIFASVMALIPMSPQAQFDKMSDPTFCMAKAIYFETRGALTSEATATGYVVKQRSEDTALTYCQIFHEKYQFYDISVKKKHLGAKFEPDAWKNSIWIAMGVIHNTLPNPVPGAVYFCNPKTTTAAWCKYSTGVNVGRMKYITREGYRTTPIHQAAIKKK